ncbi:prenyltransferase [Leptospira sp. GIMC2001]|uniref:prenyltransferase n=1 Tax=Leptospira sp. GIMC2001 TaxID=1513297 RepID=UPI00234BC2C2|nr:prenyltransferase [Leptospira sp. GIMC2001]WCL50903.1 prenyltransferase [Leptospira sp. GIMC2001]
MSNFLKTISIWIKASRLPSQSYIFFPIFLGQSLAYSLSGNWNQEIFILMTMYGIFIQLFIVYGNDCADYETDKLNQDYTIFSGGSRVLVDGNLTRPVLMKATAIMVALCFAIGILLHSFFHLKYSYIFIFSSVLLLFLYSYPPGKFSYRGGGEFLQTLGVSTILPVFGFYSQSQNLFNFPYLILLILVPTHLACAIATSLPDRNSDFISHKKTIAVIYGLKNAKFIIILLNLLTISFWIFCYLYLPNWNLNLLWIIIPIIAILTSLFFIQSEPGNIELSIFVFLNLLCTIGITAGLAFHFRFMI